MVVSLSQKGHSSPETVTEAQEACGITRPFTCQDYRWWWRTFLVSGGSAFYVLIYAIFYFVNKVLSLLLYEGATFLEETVGFGKGNGRTAQSQPVPRPAQGR